MFTDLAKCLFMMFITLEIVNTEIKTVSDITDLDILTGKIVSLYIRLSGINTPAITVNIHKPDYPRQIIRF